MYNTNKYHTTTKTRPTRTTTTSSGAELPPLLKRTFQFSENRMAVSDLWSSLWGGSLSCLQSLPYSAWPLFQGATHQQFWSKNVRSSSSIFSAPPGNGQRNSNCWQFCIHDPSQVIEKLACHKIFKICIASKSTLSKYETLDKPTAKVTKFNLWI